MLGALILASPLSMTWFQALEGRNYFRLMGGVALSQLVVASSAGDLFVCLKALCTYFPMNIMQAVELSCATLFNHDVLCVD